MSASLTLTLLLVLAQGLRDDTYLSAIEEATDPVYRLDYEEAIARLDALGERYPAHPGPPLAEGAAIWLRELFRRQDLDLERFVSPGYFTKPAEQEMPAAERDAFEARIAESQERARRLLEADPHHPDARYYLGSAEGILGAFAITIDRDKLDAFGHGKSAYRWHRELVEEVPEYYDAYMTVGTYEYIVDNLPWYVKWLAVIAGYRGSERLGFEYLVLAAEKADSVEIDARVLLMTLYVREEEYEYALRLADELRRRFPENFLFAVNAAQILDEMGREDDALERYLEIERKAEEGVPNYQKLPLAAFRFVLGNRLLEGGEPREALSRFVRSASDSRAPADVVTLSHLQAGRVLDVLGRRAEALDHYERVLATEDVEGSRRLARRYFERPFRGEFPDPHP